MGSASFKVPHTEICYKKPCKFNLLLLFLKQNRSLNVTLKNINCQGERQTDIQTDRQPLFKHDDNKSYAAYGVVHKY